MVLMWEAGWVNIPDGREQTMMRGEQERKAKIKGDVQPVTRNQKISTTSFLKTHTHKHKDMHTCHR